LEELVRCFFPSNSIFSGNIEPSIFILSLNGAVVNILSRLDSKFMVKSNFTSTFFSLRVVNL